MTAELRRALLRTGLPGAVLVVALAVVLAVSPEGGAAAVWTGDLLPALLAAAATAAAATTARRTGRRSWWWLAAGTGSWALGEVVWSVYELGPRGEAPFPSLADAGFIGLYPGVAVALLGLVRSPARSTRLRGQLEALLVAATLFLTGWLLLLHPILAAAGDEPLLATLVSVGYVVSDLVLLGLALFAVARTPPQQRLVLGLLATGIGSLAVADCAFAYQQAWDSYASGALLDCFWPCGFLLLQLAAVADREAAAATGSTVVSVRRGLALTLVPTSVALVTFLVQEASGRPVGGVALVAAGVCVVLMMAVLWSVSRENHEYTHFLQDLVDARAGQLADQERYFRALTERSSDVVTLVDQQGVVRYQSPSGARLHGRSADAVVGSAYEGLLLADDRPGLRAALAAALDEGKPVSVRSRVCADDGTLSYLDTTVVNLVEELSVRGLLLTSRDVTQQVQLQRELEHQASHDGLTGLPERDRLLEQAREELAADGAVALLLVELRDLADLHSAHGRARGDLVLRTAAATVLATCPPGAVVGRLGAEFAVVLRAGEAEAIGLGQALLLALARPMSVDGLEVALHARVGLATTQASGRAVEGLLRDADLALLSASRSDQSLGVYDALVGSDNADRVQLRTDLRRALDQDELFLEYQPVIDLADGRLLGVEALVRWQHPTRGVVPPLDFIPLAEETGLIVPLGRWVLETACRDAVRWRSRVFSDGAFTVSVNVSARQLHDAGFVEDVRRALQRSGLPAEALLLEITETALLRDLAGAVAQLEEAKSLGVRVAIDDFGVGYSSLSYLHQLPLDVLKVDRSFVSGITDPGPKAVLTRSVLDLAGALGLSTVAEGVETEEQAQALRLMGCRWAQGFLFARPLPQHRLDALLGLSAA